MGLTAASRMKEERNIQSESSRDVEILGISSVPHPPLPPLLLLEPLDVHLGPPENVRHLGLHGHGDRGGAEGMAGGGAGGGGQEGRTGGEAGHLPSQ